MLARFWELKYGDFLSCQTGETLLGSKTLPIEQFTETMGGVGKHSAGPNYHWREYSD